MSALHKIARQPAVLAARLHELEWQGRYDEALQDCLEVVDGKACVPALDGASQEETGELFLRYGALIGFLGHISQIANSQEQSKDLLTKALAEFIDLKNEDKVAECENYIALAYWRTGELNEALVWLESSFKREIHPRSRIRLHSHNIRSLVYLQKKEFEKNLVNLRGLEPYFLDDGDPFLIGNFYTNLGISLKDTGALSEALRCLKLARHWKGKTGNAIYEGLAENNLAQLYWLMDDFRSAHNAIDNAARLFRKLKDKTRAGFSLDTKANVYLAEKKYASALRVIDKAIDILKRGENAAYLVESILTRAKVLLHLDRYEEAITTLLDAIEVNRIKVGGDSVKNLIKDFALALRSVSSLRTDDSSDKPGGESGLNLLIPASLSNYAAYSGVRIHNSSLDRFGLKKGSLAIVVNQAVNRGDLVAVECKRDGSINCGIFDREFGLVSLDKGDDDLQIFDENEVKILGKIVGVGDTPSRDDDAIIIEPLPA